jgi:UDP-N-acetylmuramyl pentapeptide synthase
MKIIENILGILAKLTLVRYAPKIVGVTGSVGKTSTKNAVARVLGKKFVVRSSPENYNNQIGLPLAILGELSPGRNFIGWIWIILKGMLKLLYARYPEVLVLEMGTDRPGDIAHLVSVVRRLNAVVITDIGLSHLQFFASPQALAKEKLSILRGVPPEGVAVLNFDNQKITDAVPNVRAKVLGYGLNAKSQILASDFQIIKKDGNFGAYFKVHYKGTVVPFFVGNALGRPALYASLAAAGVGLHFGLNLVEISEAMRDFTPPAGRLCLLPGIKRTSILDDTYNSAPDSTIAALEVLNKIASARKLAALGSMAELGSATEIGHRQVAAKLMETGVRAVFLVGEETKFIEDELKKRGFDGDIFRFANSDEARLAVQNKLLEGDTILVKGSQSTRMERIVKEIMAEPMLAEKLLVRQSDKWLGTP